MVTKIYANAVAKYNEGKLLDAEKIRRLLDAEFSDAVKMLCDYGYGGGTVDAKSYDIDAFISSETAALIDYVFSSSPNVYLSRVLTNRFLYGNAKAYYKARVSGKPLSFAVYDMADGEIRAGIERGEYAALPKFMAEALDRLDTEFADAKPDPKLIDARLTEAMYADNLFCAKKSKSKSLREFVRGEIDLTNVLSALRARALKVSEAALGNLFLSGGEISFDCVVDIYRSENPLSVVSETRYGFIADGSDTVDLPLLEARTDDFLSNIWQPHAEDMLSFSPFVSYFIEQLNEYKTVKTILTCIKNNARGEIASRLRTFGKI
ncbi:V0D/AC39 family V-type ATPase subunit [Pumilibacter muris]|jgi:vacuolar-type H+-ATPase subunit C/Vma6|uniref:V0D/AC39 family V-type ATPase subunit n=1 Tax=Pumilibacter muris TaxID=2941510 RepID=UPI00203EFFDC|nr:V-type ATPase subunit [Pumilibacter muris]